MRDFLALASLGWVSVETARRAVSLSLALRFRGGKLPLTVRVPFMKSKMRNRKSGSAFLAHCEGLEPPTFWFVARHSIQLS